MEDLLTLALGFGFVLMGGETVLLGVATSRARVLPRWCGFLLVAGGGAVGLLGLALLFGVRPAAVALGAGVVLGPIWLVSSYALWSRRGEAARR